MKFCLVHGEITSIGSRGPKPQRSFLVPTVTETAVHIEVSSEGSSEPFTIGGACWSYQASESSYVTTMAVDDQSGDFSICLMVLTSQCCSSIGSELPAWEFS